MVNITLEEVSLAASSTKTQRQANIQRLQQLEQENKELNASLEELDTQHNLAMQNVLEIKTKLQDKLAVITKDYEQLKKEHAEKFINGELEMGKLRKMVETMEKSLKSSEIEQQAALKKNEQYAEELKRAVVEMADLQALLDKKTLDNVELIEKIKAASQELEQTQQQLKQQQELQKSKEKKTSESSNSSTGKQSDDEFIVVREADATSSASLTPPLKDDWKDKIEQLENQVSELTLENGSLALKLQDCGMEQQLSSQVLKENIQKLQDKCQLQEQQLTAAQQQLEEQLEKVQDLREKAAEGIIVQKQLKALTAEKQKIEQEITIMKKNLEDRLELEKRLIISEQEKEALQLELQHLRSGQERINELENKIQKLTIENQQLKLNAEAETESLNNSAELQDKLKNITAENEALRVELDSMADVKFRQAIAEEKQEITDLDAEEDEPLDLQKLRTLLTEGATESLDNAFKTLKERLHNIKSLEHKLSQVSEEILDLQDSKMVWDHEKKTMEADISQYILQCDELMKNNEILLNELENYKRNKLETIHENNEENLLQLESQLEESNKLNSTLETEYAEISEKCEELEKSNSQLTQQLRALQQKSESFTAEERNLSLQLETLELEKCNLMFELNELKSQESKQETLLQQEMQTTEQKCANLNQQLERLSTDHGDLVAALQSQKTALGEAIKAREAAEKALMEQSLKMSQLEQSLQNSGTAEKQQLQELWQDLKAKEIVNQDLSTQVFKAEQLMQELTAAKLLVETQLQETRKENETLRTTDQAQESTLKQELEKMSALNQQSCEEVRQLLEIKQSLEELHQNLQQQNDKQSNEIDALRKQLEKSPSTTTPDTASLSRIAQLEADLLATAEQQKTIESLTFEKNEMIKALQQKHAENMQYYMEIQRLQPLVQQLGTEAQKPCDKCPTHVQTIADLQKQHEKLQDQINFLKEKSDILTTNLLTEQTNQRLLLQEKNEVEEKNSTLRKDFDRLCAHLMEIEEAHTKETVETQKELEETKAKMMGLQQEVSKSSNAYTSASIRANQHAETLQAQYALVLQQRDELVAKLSLAEDKESKNQAALVNLQCALEQFQNDKENDIKAATLRIRKELACEITKESQLQAEISALNQQLIDANQGLRAASRLTDQLESSQQNIAALREEIETLKQQNVALQTKLNSSESSQSDKIEKNLIKSLLIGYVVSGNPNDKTQVLRMISSVLDFTAVETDKVGLNKQQQSSWLGSILGGGASTAGAHSNDNLVQAFVQFLEQESQPKANTENMPNLLNYTQQQASPPSRRTSASSSGLNTAAGSSTGATNSPVQPILLNSTVLDEFAPSRNSSTILKDILSDS